MPKPTESLAEFLARLRRERPQGLFHDPPAPPPPPTDPADLFMWLAGACLIALALAILIAVIVR